MASGHPIEKLAQDETAAFIHEMLIELVRLSHQSDLQGTARVLEAAALVIVTESDGFQSPASS
ncbi:hypothetical protein V0U79_02025 [Hyphobacterium sp. HN65]|uniref:Uncharacterized protein n=1 Tax=Hyphobacterium lacteum TaxID=3116575 RepID=A0ABU7LMH7_9PROT|nr:hypothetical protein [Hyphobacterium sp. HN65]MEE2525126.1 hypothetical protein [Hyphobacterium sp. HN65]